MIMDWEKNGRGIGFFHLNVHTQSITHRLKLLMDWEENRNRHWSLPIIHTHKKNNSLPNGLKGKEERHWSLQVIHAHTKHKSPAEVDNGLGARKRGEAMVTSSYACTHKTQLTS